MAGKSETVGTREPGRKNRIFVAEGRSFFLLEGKIESKGHKNSTRIEASLAGYL